MAKVVKQYRFYGRETATEPNPKNWPKDQDKRPTSSRFKSGSAFFSDLSLGSIVQLGVQTWPGVKFYVNNSPEPIIVGSTGIYELNLRGLAEITSLSFDGESVDRIEQSGAGYIIVDAIYEAEEE